MARQLDEVLDADIIRFLEKNSLSRTNVLLFQDYAPSVVNGRRVKQRSPYAKFYIDAKTKARFMVTSMLPKVDANGDAVEVGWTGANGKYNGRLNLFHAITEGTRIALTCKNLQPDGLKPGEVITWDPQLFIGVTEYKPGSPTLKDDYHNPNYKANVVEWDYSVCVRRLRIIEGRIRETWVFDKKPSGDIQIRHNASGKLKMGFGTDAEGRLIPVSLVGDVETVSLAALDEAVFPIEVGASRTFYPDSNPESTSVDGQTERDPPSHEVWATLEAGAGTAASDTVPFGYNGFRCSGDSGKWAYIFRSIYLYDTSPIPNNATKEAATISLYSSAKYDEGSQAPRFNVYSSNPASNTALQASDHTTLGTTPFATEIPYASWATGQYNDLTLNADGLNAVSLSGVSKFGSREAHYDAGPNTPSWGSYWKAYFYTYYSEQGSGYEPKLVVQYTVPGGGGDNRGLLVAAGIV